MNSWELWQTLLYQRSPYPLFIRVAPRAHSPTGFSFWYILTGYTFVGMLTVLFTSALALQDELSAVVFVVFMYPSMLVGLFGMVFSPFVLGGGIIFGIRFANNISAELQTLERLHMGDIIATTPPGQIGIYRAICAGNMRQKNLFMGLGIYDGSAAHLALTTGLVIPAVFLAFTVPQRELMDSSPPILLTVTLVTLLSAIAIGLLHLDFRQYLMLGITAGIFGSTVLHDRFDMRTGTFVIFAGVGGVGMGILALIAGSLSLSLSPLIAPAYYSTGMVSATLLGYGLGIAAKETVIHYLWQILIEREDIQLS